MEREKWREMRGKEKKGRAVFALTSYYKMREDVTDQDHFVFIDLKRSLPPHSL